jgi:hypothetical protein
MVIVDFQRLGRQLQLFSINAISHYMCGQMNYFAFRIIYHTIKVKQITGDAKLIFRSKVKMSSVDNFKFCIRNEHLRDFDALRCLIVL